MGDYPRYVKLDAQPGGHLFDAPFFACDGEMVAFAPTDVPSPGTVVIGPGPFLIVP